MDILQIIGTAMTPIGELRASIPLGITILGLPTWMVFIFSVIGNLIPVPIILFCLNKGEQFLNHMPGPIKTLLNWRIKKIEKTYQDKIAKYGSLFLIILVMIPLPFTGAWTATLASWIFKIPPIRAFSLITIGIILAGLLVTLLTITAVEIGENI